MAFSVLIAGGAAMTLTDTHIFTGSKSDEQQLGELRQLLAVELEAVSAKHQELEEYRRIFDERSELLSAQIAEVNAQSIDLETKRQQLESQSVLVAELINDIDSARDALNQRRDPDEMLDQEIAAISAQRIALEKRWKQFEAQGELLATEIIAVNAQRRELEAQRQLMDRQQRQLQALIDRAIEIDDRRTSEARTPKLEQQTTPPDIEQIAYANLSTVGDGTLEEMRGGMSIGDDLDIAFGITQTGSVNGVEQYRSGFVIDDLNSDVSSIDLTNMNAVLIQNGEGNFASPDVFDTLSSGFGGIIQNSLDDQVIATSTIYDVSIQNVSGALQGHAASQALADSLSFSQ